MGMGESHIDKLSDLRARVEEYLAAANGQVADEILAKCLSTIRDLITGDLEIAEAEELLTNLALIMPLHTMRKRKHEEVALYGNGIRALASAFDGNDLGWLRKQMLEHFGRVPGISWQIRLPLHFFGFDPRDNDAKKNWQALLDSEVAKNPRKLEISHPTAEIVDDYNKSKARIYADFHDPTTRYDLLLVDFAWLPELAYLGHVVPLDPFFPKIRDLIREKVSAVGKERTEWWTNVVSYLGQAGNDSIYALPVIVNFHGVLRKKDKDGTPRRDLYGQDYIHCGLQNAHSACCVYELYAHFAYHGALPLVCSPSSEGKYRLRSLAFTSEKACNAIADYLARIALVSLNKNNGIQRQVESFALDHILETRAFSLGEERIFSHAVCFSSELRNRVPGLDFEGPYAKSDTEADSSGNDATLHNRYLSSLGGYGLAVSRQAGDVDFAVEMAARLFEAGPSPIDSDAASWFVETLDAKRFMDYHCRPRIPFWSHIEELISFAIEDLYLGMRHTLGLKDATLGAVSGEIFARLQEPEAQRILTRLEAKIKLAVRNAGWEV